MRTAVPFLPARPVRARAMLHRFRVTRQFDMHDQAERGQVDAARGDVSGDADAGALVAQRLQRMVALILAMLARQGHGRKAALGKARMQMADIVARGAEQDGCFRFMETQQVDHRILDVGRRHRHRLVADVAMAALFRHGRNAQRILLVPLGHRHDGLGHGGGKEQRAPIFGRAIEDRFQILAKAHVEHLVGFVQHHRSHGRQVQRAAFQMVAQAAGRADDDMRAMAEVAALLGRVHPAHAGGDAGARGAIEPFQLAADLQRQFARRCDHQRQRQAGNGQALRFAQQFARHGQAEGDGLARTGLRRHQKVAAMRFLLRDFALDRSQCFIALGDEGL